MKFDFIKHLTHQMKWSKKTFGPGLHTLGLLDHIAEELKEIEAEPLDLEEWIDAIILSLDGAWRCAAKSYVKPEDAANAVASMLKFKQKKNEKRDWPDWKTAEPNAVLKHIKEAPSEYNDYEGLAGRGQPL